MSDYKINISAELMDNWIQADILVPEARFLALQTKKGLAVLFSIGDGPVENEKVCYVTCETPGDRHGWERTPISDGLIKQFFPGGASCSNFAASQSNTASQSKQESDGTIQVAAVIRDGNDDHVFLSLGNSAADAKWVKSPETWLRCPFNAKDSDGNAIQPPAPFQIADVYISEATDGEYIVADVVENPGSAVGHVSRYYIDVKDRHAPRWYQHSLGVTLDAAHYSTCLGRSRNDNVDGLYTAGQVSGGAVFTYQPLYDEFDRTAKPPVSRLYLTSDHLNSPVPDAIASCRNPDNTTDLFATHGGSLYYFASDNQGDGATAVKLTDNRRFTGVRSLFASRKPGMITVWGLNSSNEVFYTKCTTRVLDAGAWSYPLEIMVGVEHVSPFVNRANSALTFFAHTGTNELKLAVKAPDTGLWSLRSVTLPPVSSKPRSFNSYTTRIQITRPADDPAPKKPVLVTITSKSATSVHINHNYYVVSQQPIYIAADGADTLTIVEAVTRLDATKFSVAIDNSTINGTSNPEISPTEHSPTIKGKLQKLKKREGLLDAKILSQTPGVPGKNFVMDSVRLRAEAGNKTDLDNLDNAANNVDGLLQSLDHVQRGGTNRAMFALLDHDSINYLEVDKGDLLSMLDSRMVHISTHRAAANFGEFTRDAQLAGNWFWELIVRAFEGAWHFIVKIGEEVFGFILHVAEEVWAAFKYVFPKIAAAIEDVINYVKYLFEVDDIRRTKEVFKNLTKLFLDDQVSGIQTLKDHFDAQINEFITEIEKWAGIGDLQSLGAHVQAKVGQKSDPTSGPTATGALLSNHFQGNVDRAEHASNSPSITPPDATVIDALVIAKRKMEDDLKNEFAELGKLIDDASTMTFLDVLKKLVGIIGSGTLKLGRDALDCLFDVFIVVAREMAELLDHPIYIPVVTEILQLFGIPEFSILDVLCWIAAIPFTIGYKIGQTLAGQTASAPFPKGDQYSDFLINAKNFESVLNAFHGTHNPSPMVRAITTDGPISMPPATAKLVSMSLHTSAGFFGMITAGFDVVEAPIPSNEVPGFLTYGGGCTAIVGGLSRAVANVLVPRCPLQNSNIVWCNRGISALFVCNKIFWTGPVQEKLNLKAKFEDARAFGSSLDALLAIFSVIPTCFHFCELAGQPAGTPRTIAILDECSSVSSYIARLLYQMLTFPGPKEPDTEIGLLVGMGGAELVYSGFQIAEAVLEA